MIGCVIAMQSEAEALLQRADFLCEQSVFGKKVKTLCVFGRKILLVVCGEGKVNAATGACAVLASGADLLLNFGVAGGLLPDRTKIGEVYLIDRVVQYDFDLTELNHEPLGTLPGEKENFLPLYCPKGLKLPRRSLGTGDRFNDSPEDHETLLSLGCEIREMEAGAIAQVAKSAKVPFVSVKAISDVYGSGSTTGQFQQNLEIANCNIGNFLPELFASIG